MPMKEALAVNPKRKWSSYQPRMLRNSKKWSLRLRLLLLQREPLVQNQRIKGSYYPKIKGGLKGSVVVIIVACKGTQGQIASSFMHLRRLTLCATKKIQEEDQIEHKLKEKVRDNSLEMLWKCWRTFHYALLASPRGLKVMLVIPLHLRISPKTLVKGEWRRVLMHDHSLCPCINTSNVLGS